MKHHYKDIRSRIKEEPKWWDENGVPRYCGFSPDETSNIYAREAVLLRIACQRCQQEFDVCLSCFTLKEFLDETPSLKKRIEDESIHYGDPPNAGCCPAGPTMNSEPLRVLEYWHKVYLEWERVHDLEVSLEV